VRTSRRLTFDHLVGGRKQGRWDRKTKQPCDLSVENQLELRRSQDREVCGLGAFENPPGIDAHLAIGFRHCRLLRARRERNYELVAEFYDAAEVDPHNVPGTGNLKAPQVAPQC
jgi:hypothetical protein